MANEAPKSFDFTEHDKQFHKGRFVEGKMKCKFRDQIKKYESADRLDGSGTGVDYSKFKDDAENFESIEALIDKVSTPDMKKYLKAMLAKVEAKLGGGSSESASGGVSQQQPARVGYGPNKPLEHDDSAFPSGAAWDAALANYGRGDWHGAGSGSTSPHYIDFNGKRYFVKKAGYGKSTYTEEAAQNEVNANNFIRLAGFNAPDSKYYDTPAGQFAVSLGQDLGKTLDTKIGKDKDIDKAVRSAYPLMALMYNMDLMQNADNAFIGPDGKPLFLDNGSTFGFSAQGARNKYYDFDKRDDPFPSKSISGGLMGLLDVGNNSSRVWGDALGSHADKESILKECAKYEMGDLVRDAKEKGLLDHLPKKGVKALEEYADKLDNLSKKYKSQPATKTEAAPSIQQSGSSDGSGFSSQTALQKLAAKYGISNLTTKKNADGTMTLGGLGNISQKQLLDFVRDLNKSGLIPGFVASLTRGGQIQTTQAITQNAFSSFASMNHVGTGVSAVSGITSMPSGGYGISLSSSISGNSRVANSMAKWINSSNSFPGYTANAVQNKQTGNWEITLYPTNSVQQAQIQSQTSGSSSSSGATQYGGSFGYGSSGGGSSSSRSSTSGGSSSSSSQPSQSSGSSSTSTTPAQPSKPSSQAPQQPATPAPAPAPNINTQTPQQVAAQVKQMSSSAAGAFVAMLNRRVNSPNTPAGLKVKYQRVLAAINGTSAPAPATGLQASGSASVSSAAQALNTPLAKRLQAQLAQATPGSAAYQNIVNRLNALAGSSAATSIQQQQSTAPTASTTTSATPSQAAMAMTTPLAKRLQAQLAKTQVGTPAYQSIVQRLNALANIGSN